MQRIPYRIAFFTIAVVLSAAFANGSVNFESSYNNSLFITSARGRQDPQTDPPDMVENKNANTGKHNHPPFVRQLLGDVPLLVKAPDFYVIAGGISLAPIVFKSAFSRESTRLNERWGSSKTADHFFEFGAALGQVTVPLAASISLLAMGRIGIARSMESFGSDLFQAQVINGIITLSIKSAINRTRPDGDRYSYPSGHASSSFATAAVVYGHFGPVWGIPAIVAGSYIGLSRLQENKHYLSDVAAGAILGYYIGSKISHQRRDNKVPFIAPIIRSRNYGIEISYEF
jgi:membrane-associated phospholipid phosphatase